MNFIKSTHLGITIAIRIPCGKYSILSLTSAVELKLAAATGSTWNLTYDNSTQKFKITSSDDFTFHFGASAEINSGWYTSTGAPSNNNATVLMARYLGFVPNCSYYSINKTLESVVKSSFPMYQKYPRYSKLNDPRVPSMSHTESTSSTRLQKYNYVVGSRDPPTRKIGIGCRHTSCITCSLTNAVLDASSGSSYLDNADAGAMYSITLQSSGYTFTPPFAQQVGTFVKLSNTSTSRSATAQVASVYLAACMGAGARVLRAAPLAVAGVYDHHGSVVYGAVRHGASRRIASCSFYDRGVHVWSDE